MRRVDIFLYSSLTVVFIIVALSLLYVGLASVAPLIFSLIQAVLVIILVWYNLSERPELRILHVRFGYQRYPSVTLIQAEESFVRYDCMLGKIWRTSIPQEYKDNLYVSTDIANVGFREVVIHEYHLEDVQANRRIYGPIPLFEDVTAQRRMSLKIQGRYTVWAPVYSRLGFSKMRFVVFATTMKTTKEFWFYKNGSNIFYVEPSKIRRIFVKLLSCIGYPPQKRLVDIEGISH